MPRGRKLGEEEEKEGCDDEAYWTHQGPEKETPERSERSSAALVRPRLWLAGPRLPAVISGLKRTCIVL